MEISEEEKTNTNLLAFLWLGALYGANTSQMMRIKADFYSIRETPTAPTGREEGPTNHPLAESTPEQPFGPTQPTELHQTAIYLSAPSDAAANQTGSHAANTLSCGSATQPPNLYNDVRNNPMSTPGGP